MTELMGESFADNYEDYLRLVRMFVGQWVRESSWRMKCDFDDLVQECLMRIWAKEEKVKRSDTPQAYIRRLCRQECRRYAEERTSDAIFKAIRIPDDQL